MAIPTITITLTPEAGLAPLDTVITWSSENAAQFAIGGDGLSSVLPSGSANLTLGNGVHEYVADAVGSEGETATLTAVAVASNNPLISGSLSVKFSDRTILRSDAWEWDFGDGFTSSLQNPTHTYSDIGDYIVKLTAVCGDRTDIKYRVLRILCFSDDPLPFAPSWDSLDNEESYGPFVDPRYVGSDYSSPFGPRDSRESDVSNPNWIACPTIDYCDGPLTVGSPQFRFNQRWVVELLPSGIVEFGIVGVARGKAPTSLFPSPLTNAVNISMAFSTSSLPFWAFETSDGMVHVRYLLTTGAFTTTFEGSTPLLFGESVINPITELTDVVCYYAKDGSLYCRFQRDSFGIAYLLATPISYDTELATLTKVDAMRSINRIYTYGRTISGERLLFRSGVYPAFPSPDPIVVDVDDAGRNAVTLSSVVHTRVDTFDFTTLEIGLDVSTYARGDLYGPVDEWVSIENGTHGPGEEKTTETVSIENGVHLPFADWASNAIDWLGGTHALLQGSGSNALTFNGGTHGSTQDSGSNALTITNLTHAPLQEAGSNAVTFIGGTSSQYQGSGRSEVTLVDGTHDQLSEAITVSQTLFSVDHQVGTYKSKMDMTFEGGNSATGIFELLNVNETLDSLAHAPLHFKSNVNTSLDGGSTQKQLDKARNAITITQGWHVLNPPEPATENVSIEDGAHYFMMFTWDNTDAEHFDSTTRTWDLDVSQQPDIA